jgi:hypothetical protein
MNERGDVTIGRGLLPIRSEWPSLKSRWDVGLRHGAVNAPCPLLY